ncbi:MBL fold metallo-hydrolase [Bryocella elongata]|uniref:MBL fold metallo-hydrolase n=1 Tax=Bryocella elongata TaxID=863522 RepID=UPI002E100A7A
MTLPVGLLGCNCTILGDETTREAIVVDPGADIPQILSALAKHQLTARKIVITHAHFDHIASAQELKQLTGAPIVYNKADLPLVAIMADQPTWVGIPKGALGEPDVRPPDHSPADEEHLVVGGIDATVLHTPGHTEGSLSLWIPAEGLLLAGDTLFAGGVGRTDFPGGNTGKLLASIKERLLPLPGATVVVPGHGPDTTILEERVSNPYVGEAAR